MSNKLVSVVIPAYNVEKYIKQAIESVLLQDYKNLEIIVVDDGSTDNTGKILSEYEKKDSRIKVITQINKGLAGARNTGLVYAKGDYLCILDSDDIMLPDKISKQSEFLEFNPEYDITYSGLYHFVDGDNDIFHHPINALGYLQYDSLLYGNVINPNTVFFKRSVFESCGGFDETLRSAEDWEYWLNLTYRGLKFGYQEIPLTLYRMRKNSLSANSILMMQTPLNVLEKQLSLSLNDKQKQIIELEIEHWRKRLCMSYFTSGNKKEAKKIMLKMTQSRALLKFASMIPPWLLKLRYFIMKKIKFPISFKPIENSEVKNYLLSIEKYGEQ